MFMFIYLVKLVKNKNTRSYFLLYEENQIYHDSFFKCFLVFRRFFIFKASLNLFCVQDEENLHDCIFNIYFLYFSR